MIDTSGLSHPFWLLTSVFDSNNLRGPSVPSCHQHLLPRPLLSRLRLHLLHLQRVQPPPAHKQVVVSDAQLEDLHPNQTDTAAVSVSSPRQRSHPVAPLGTHQLVDSLPRGVELEDVCLLVQRFDGELSRAEHKQTVNQAICDQYGWRDRRRSVFTRTLWPSCRKEEKSTDSLFFSWPVSPSH